MNRHDLLTICFLVLGASAAFVGCAQTDPAVDRCEGDECVMESDNQCESSNDCGISLTCLRGECVEPPTCTTQADCSDGACVEGRCLGDRDPVMTNNSNAKNSGETNSGTNGSTNNADNNEDWPLRLCHSETDVGGDGLIERTNDREYDEEGVHIASESRNQDIENWNYRETYTYDSEGRRLRTDRDIGFDGNVDIRTSFIYSDAGLLIEEKEDRDLDGNIDSTTRNTYDSSNRRVREQIIWDEMEVHRVREFIYNAGGKLTEETVDYGDDGIDSRTFYEYDGEGREVLRQHDFDNDGAPDMQIATIYEDGKRVRVEEDDDGDGTIDAVTTYEYERGREVLRRKETPTGGLLSLQTTAYTDMDEGIDVAREYDNDGDRTIDETSLSNWRYHPSCTL